MKLFIVCQIDTQAGCTEKVHAYRTEDAAIAAVKVMQAVVNTEPRPYSVSIEVVPTELEDGKGEKVTPSYDDDIKRRDELGAAYARGFADASNPPMEVTEMINLLEEAIDRYQDGEPTYGDNRIRAVIKQLERIKR